MQESRSPCSLLWKLFPEQETASIEQFCKLLSKRCTIKVLKYHYLKHKFFFRNTFCSKSEAEVSRAVLAGGNAVDGRLLALESRISRLEQMVDGAAGPDESAKVCKIPVAEAVEDLRMRVQLLHPAHVDGLHARITQLLSKLQQVVLLFFSV